MNPRDRLARLFSARPSISKRQLRVLFVIGLVLGLMSPHLASGLAALLGSSYSASSGVTYRASNGPAVELGQNVDMQSGNPFPDANTVELNTSQGNATFTSTGSTNATIAEITGEWTNITNLDVSSANLTVNPEDKRRIGVGGDADTLKYRSMTVGDGQTDFVYSGASGTTTLTLYGLPENSVIGLYDPASSEVLAGGRTDSSGTLTVETPNSEHTVQLVESDGDPEFDDGTASPTGDQSGMPNSLSINVSDPDFPEDTVNVTFYLNGSEVGTDTLNDAGTASVSITQDLSSGSNEWYAVAEDRFDQDTTSSTYEFGVPDELQFYNESSPQELLNNTTIETTIYADEQVFNRTTTDGTINLSGLPAGERLVITADAEGFHARHVVIESLAEQHRVYLLPDENVSSVEVRFTLEDKTGQFPEDSTVLYIKKPVTLNNTTNYQTIAADTFGQAGFTQWLEEDIRYRLVIENANGDQRVLGSYTSSVAETVTLTVGELGFGAGGGDDAYQWDASHQNESSGESVKFSFSDPENATKNLQVRIYERGNESNEIFDESYDGPHGEFSVTQPIPGSSEGLTWIVEWEASRNSEPISGQRVVGADTGDFGMPLDSMWMAVASLGLLVVFGGMFGGVRASLGVGVIAVVGGFFWYIRWLPSEVGAGAVVLVLALAAFYAVAGRGGV